MIRAAMDGLSLDLDLSQAERGRAIRQELQDQIGDYLIPRLERLDAPLLAVIGGSTGSGKSTITNSLIGAEVSTAGVLRPTTRAPVLVCHPDDADWFAGDKILPGLARVTGDRSGGDAGRSGPVLRVVEHRSLGRGVALIDAPDIDSVEEANRNLATQLLAAADLWLFTTTAVRYADAVPWDFLKRAQERGTALAVIINRIPEGAAAEIVPHFESMVDQAGLDDVPVFPIENAELIEGRLPIAKVADVHGLLVLLASDAEERARVVARTLVGAINSIEPRGRQVVAAGREQYEVAEDLRIAVDDAYAKARADLGRDLSSGKLLRGEVLDRWQELIGTAELMRAVQSRIAWVRDRVTGFVTGRTAGTAEVQGEITSTLERLLDDHADAAAAHTVSQWRGLPGGRQLLDDDRALGRRSLDFDDRVGPEVRAWQDDILDLVSERGAGKRTTARIAALGLNSIGVALMIVLFAQTGGITGGEVAIAGGTAGLSQTLLTAIFGEQAVRDLAAEARRRLLERSDALLEADANRFRQRLWATVSPPEKLDELDDALSRLGTAR
ncbi:MAG: dynamin family protein [Actinomycetota bacterium]